MTKDSEKWLNLFLAVEDIEKIKKSFNNLTTEMLHQKIINLHNELNKKVEKNKNQALEITKLLEQKKDLQDKLNQANRVVKLTIDNSSKLANFLDEKNEIIKEKENKLNQLNSMSNYVDDFHYRLKEKDIIISYLRSELK